MERSANRCRPCVDVSNTVFVFAKSLLRPLPLFLSVADNFYFVVASACSVIVALLAFSDLAPVAVVVACGLPLD